MAERVPTPQDEEPTIGRLVGDVSRDVSTLISKEIELAKSELTFSAKAGGLGAALLGAAAFVLLLGVIILSIAIALLIGFTGLDLAWCFLIVFAAYLLVAVALAVVGVKKLRQVKAPTKSIEQLKESKTIFAKSKPAALPTKQAQKALPKG